MRHHYRRRTSGKIYNIIEQKTPVKLSPAVIAAALCIMFIMFTATCFAAVIFSTASIKLDTAYRNVTACKEYYEAETTATDILSVLAADDGNSLTDKNGELKYSYNNTEITISRNGGNFSFDVPISKNKQTLHVIAQIETGNINIIQWCIK